MSSPLKYINVINYQSHSNTLIKLSPRITGIVGESLEGKTAIIRAFRWAWENRPSGFKYHSNFDKKNNPTEVKIGADKTLTVTKTKKDHTYKIGEKTFRKVGRNVPQEAINLLNLGDINFQDQLDPPFLVTSTHGKISKAISEILHSDRIEKAISTIRKEKNSLEAEKKVLSSDIEEAQIKIDNLETLDDIRPIIKKIKKTDKRIDKLLIEESYLEHTQVRIKKLTQRIKLASKAEVVSSLIKDSKSLAYKIESLKEEEELIEQILKCKKSIKKHKKQIEKTAKILRDKLKKQGKCPFCYKAFKAKDIKRITEKAI